MSYTDFDKIQKETSTEFNAIIKDMNQQMQDMHKEAEDMLEQVRKMKENFTWSSWEPYKIKLIPKRINGKWYWRGDTVYRKQRFATAGMHYKYGDLFDYMKEL